MLQARSVLKEEVSSWEGVSVHPHQFAAQEYRYGRAEVGHVHFWGDVDIPYPLPIRDFLLEQNLAERHRWIPDSGWTTFRIRDDQDVPHAIWLMRLSYLRYALKVSAEPGRLLEIEDQRHSFGPGLLSMLSHFVPASAHLVTATTRLGSR
jgi:hypothetical protein